MSYDIRFGVKVAGAPEDCFAVIGAPEYDSPTYNLRDMFVACMEWDYEQGTWYTMTEVMPKLARGINELMLNRKKYEKYNPSNGWGSLDGALECLRSIIDWFTDDFKRGWNEDIPIECIYMSW